MTSFSFDFVSTHRDLLDALEASRTRALRMRRILRIVFGILGLLFLALAIASPLLERHMTTPWAPLLWLGLGLLFTWRYIARPLLIARHVRQSNPAEQRVVVNFQDRGIDVIADGIGEFHREWSDLLRVLPESQGVAFVFSNGASHWLPNRVFKAPSQRTALLNYSAAKIVEKRRKR